MRRTILPMRAYEPGGRFTTDFELNEVGEGITWDATNPFGTHAELWKFDKDLSVKDPIYDVEPYSNTGGGRVWDGPYELHIISASQDMGAAPVTERGFYSVDTLELLVNVDDLYKIWPEIFAYRGMVRPTFPELDKSRIVWKSQVYRPVKSQLQGYIDDRGTIIKLNCIQMMPDELVNDAQFLQYAQGA